MGGETILDITKGEMGRVAEAMRSIVSVLEDNAGGEPHVFLCKFEQVLPVPEQGWPPPGFELR